MEIHPAALMFPEMGEAAYAAFRDDIAANGLRDAITLYQGMILDGRHRERACRELGKPLKAEEYKGDNPVAFVVSRNYHRRDLTAGQRAMVAEGLANMPSGQPEETRVAMTTLVSAKEAANRLNVNRASLFKAREVRREGIPEVGEAIMSGKLPLRSGLSISRLPKAEQAAALAKKLEKKPKRRPKPAAAQPAAMPSPQELERRSRAVGLVRANDAIDQLMRIPRDDIHRMEGFKLVTDWIKRQSKEHAHCPTV